MPYSRFTSLFCRGSGNAGDIREHLKRLATPVVFRAGATIFSKGERADCAFGISEGSVRLYKLLSDRQFRLWPSRFQAISWECLLLNDTTSLRMQLVRLFYVNSPKTISQHSFSPALISCAC